MEDSNITDEQLATEAAREGSDGSAFRALLDRLRDRIWRVCFRLMGNAEDANDAAQEVFVRLFFQRTRFEGRSRYATWAHGIAIRTCLMLRRARGRRRTHESAAGQADAVVSQNRAEMDAPSKTLDLMQMLEFLDDEDRALLLMKYGEGYSHDELAEIFQITLSACKMRISRACARLREQFPEQNFGDD